MPTGPNDTPNAALARIAAFFEPTSVAVVGASANRSFASNILANLRRWGFRGPVYPVNPNYESVQELRCYPSLTAVPGAVDLVIVGIGSAMVQQVLADCEAKGVRAVTVVSSGFADMGGEVGRQRQTELAAWARRTGIAVSGPNCLGLMNAHNGMVALPTPFQTMIAGGVSAVVQSGMLAPSLLMPLLARDIGLRCIVSTGNEVDVDAADYISYLAGDAATLVIACYLEQIKDPSRFIAACERAADAHTPIVMIKAGRSEGARRAALAHTGSLVGADNVVDATLTRLGVIRVDTIDDLIECAAALHSRTLPRGDRVAVVSPSGGVSSVISDLAQSCRINLPQPSAALAGALKQAIPDFGAVGNPLDVTGQSVFATDILRKSLHALGASGEYDVILWARDFPAGLDRLSPVGRILEESAQTQPDVPLLVSSVVGGHMFRSLVPDEPMQERTTALLGIPFLQGTAPTLVAVSALVRYAEFQRNRSGRTLVARVPPDSLRAAAKRLALAQPGALTERESKEILALVGVPVTREFLAATAEEAVAAASRIAGPVALKIEAPDIMHKTDAKCVLLGLETPGEVVEGFSRVLANARSYKPDADVRGVLVQEMVEDGVDVIVGMTRDSQFGPVLLVGLGGIWVEILKDVQYLVPPLTEEDVRAALARLRGAAMFHGARGSAPVDLDAVVDAVLRFTELVVVAPPSLAEIDINPIRALAVGKGVKALDALFVTGGHRVSTEAINADA